MWNGRLSSSPKFPSLCVTWKIYCPPNPPFTLSASQSSVGRSFSSARPSSSSSPAPQPRETRSVCLFIQNGRAGDRDWECVFDGSLVALVCFRSLLKHTSWSSTWIVSQCSSPPSSNHNFDLCLVSSSVRLNDNPRDSISRVSMTQFYNQELTSKRPVVVGMIITFVNIKQSSFLFFFFNIHPVRLRVSHQEPWLSRGRGGSVWYLIWLMRVCLWQ